MAENFDALIASYLATLGPTERSVASVDIARLTSARVESVPQLITAMRRPEPEFAAVACWLAGKLRLLESASVLAEVFEASTDPSVIWEAAKALVLLRRGEAQFRRTLQKGLSFARASAAVWALGASRCVDAVPELIRLLLDERVPDDVRAHAAESLGMIKAQEALPHLLTALTGPGADVRYWAAYALGEIGNANAVPALRHVAATDVTETRWGTVAQEAKSAIGRILDQDAQP